METRKEWMKSRVYAAAHITFYPQERRDKELCNTLDGASLFMRLRPIVSTALKEVGSWRNTEPEEATSFILLPGGIRTEFSITLTFGRNIAFTELYAFQKFIGKIAKVVESKMPPMMTYGAEVVLSLPVIRED